MEFTSLYKNRTRTLIIHAPYIGSDLSMNHCYYPYRRGAGGKGAHLKATTRRWMKQLAKIIKQHLKGTMPVGKLRIGIEGYFVNKRAQPDLHNLHYVIANAIMDGTAVDDRHYLMSDVANETGYDNPYLLISIKFSGFRYSVVKGGEKSGNTKKEAAGDKGRSKAPNRLRTNRRGTARRNPS